MVCAHLVSVFQHDPAHRLGQCLPKRGDHRWTPPERAAGLAELLMQGSPLRRPARVDLLPLLHHQQLPLLQQQYPQLVAIWMQLLLLFQCRQVNRKQ